MPTPKKKPTKRAANANCEFTTDDIRHLSDIARARGWKCAEDLLIARLQFGAELKPYDPARIVTKRTYKRVWECIGEWRDYDKLPGWICVYTGERQVTKLRIFKFRAAYPPVLSDLHLMGVPMYHPADPKEFSLERVSDVLWQCIDAAWVRKWSWEY